MDEKSSYKAQCNTCPYWKHQPGQTVNVAAPLAGAAHVQVESGQCVHGRPTMMALPVANALTRQMDMVIQRTYPAMLANEFCAEHPARATAREYAHAQARERAVRDMVDYSPDKHGDGHAGFSAAPSLADAKRLAVVVKQCAARFVDDYTNIQCKLAADHGGDHAY